MRFNFAHSSAELFQNQLSAIDPLTGRLDFSAADRLLRRHVWGDMASAVTSCDHLPLYRRPARVDQFDPKRPVVDAPF
jgi:hypothetical protein